MNRKSISSLFICTISTVDLIQCFFGILPLIGGNLFAAIRFWPISGTLFCTGYSFFSTGLRTVNFYLVGLIAFDRRKMIKTPFSDRCNEKNAKIAVWMLILSGFIVGIPPAFGVSTYQYDYSINVCHLNWCRKIGNH